MPRRGTEPPARREPDVGAIEHVAAYPYGPAWQSAVDRNSEDWRAYCEARGCVRRFLAVEALEGREAARQMWLSYLAAACARRGEAGVARLQADFALVGAQEGPALRAAAGAVADAEWRARFGVGECGPATA